MASQERRSSTTSLPTGNVTFLFSDIEGSTLLAGRLGKDWPPVLERHQVLLRAAFLDAGGVEIATEGDSFFVVFQSAVHAVEAAVGAQRALAAEAWPAAVGSVAVRIGLHTGEGVLGGDNYVGLDVHRAARIAAAAHGGQTLLSGATAGLVAGSLPSDFSFRELGDHRLKDLERPERLVQVDVPDLNAEFPPPRTLEAPTNLPPQLTTFVGREGEVAAIVRMLKATRLLTLTGPGGTGKTRLSLRVADDVRAEFTGGTFFVALGTVTDPALIPPTIAQAIGVREEARRPILETLKDYLGDRSILLVLDNFEQLVAGAAVVGELLSTAPHLTVLATSREVLHIHGEQEYPVPPLALPDARNLPPLALLSHYDAVALFIQRARAVRPDFAVTNDNAAAVAAICARLDGLPLAIELAAARTKLFTPDAILGRLEKRLTLLTGGARDLPARQQTLRGAIDWSHDLLDTPERTLLRRLAVFNGGCTFESATALCDPDGDLGIDVVDGLTSLVDKSLIRHEDATHGEPRFRMLETIREYAADRLDQSPEGRDTWRRYGEYFSALALAAEPELMGPHQVEWLDRLDEERDNLRAALQRMADDGQVESALEMAAALWRFWQQRGRLAEGREALTSLLNRSQAANRTSARARALGALGSVAYWQADMAAAGGAYSEALEIERGLDDPGGLAEALFNAGFVAGYAGDHAAARSHYEEALGLHTAIGDQKGVTSDREALAFSLYHAGEFAAARALQQETVAAFRAGGEPFRIANGLSMLAAVSIRDGALQLARTSLGEAMSLYLASGNMQRVVTALILAASLAMAEGHPEQAARLSGAAATVKEPLGDIATPMQLLRIEDPAIGARSALGDEAFDAAYAEGRGMTHGEMLALVETSTA